MYNNYLEYLPQENKYVPRGEREIEQKDSKLIKYVDELKKRGYNIKWVGYADDKGIELARCLELFLLAGKKTPCSVFVPNSNLQGLTSKIIHQDEHHGILGLNNAVAAYLRKPLLNYLELYNSKIDARQLTKKN
jgi:hypothetical protein